ncbi:glycosyltransferase [Sphingobium sp. SCG-1]|uniref:glycosyltransferase n=1 Tax=Sphingobium sp. SCG-1 TaxID=2072936 RepID=UPI0011AB5E88|nr:glycosyltransferase [Sphingobium sp. SCG-1]
MALATTSPWLTVVMPVHAGEGFLAATLDSLVAQFDDGIEIILIDSSPDEVCLEIGRRYAHKLHIQLIRRPDIKPWTEKTNVGVSQARSDHIVMLHQDDLWLPGRVKSMRQWISAAPGAAVQFAPTAIIAEDGRRVGAWRCPLEAGPIDTGTICSRLIVQNFVSVPAPLFRRDAFIGVGGMDNSLWYTADWDLWLKLAQHGPVIYNPEVTAAFRVHGKSLTMSGSRNLADFVDQMEIVVKRYASKSCYETSPATHAMADASIAINAVLASAAAGKAEGVFSAIRSFLSLRPVSMLRYLHYSRLLERVLSRVRAGLL